MLLSSKNYGATNGMTSQPADAPGVPATFQSERETLVRMRQIFLIAEFAEKTIC